MRILVDVDGVCAKFTECFLCLVQKVNGKIINKEEVPNHDYFRCLGLSEEEYRATRDLLFKPGVIRSLEAMDGCYQGISKIESMGHEVVFVTSPYKYHPTWAHERVEWLNERWPDRKVVITNAKYMIAGDVIIDDKASNLEKWMEHCRDRKWHNGLGVGLLYDQPWNQGQLKGGLGCHRVFDWNDVVLEIGRLTK